jgi:hypothetical protein
LGRARARFHAADRQLITQRRRESPANSQAFSSQARHYLFERSIRIEHEMTSENQPQGESAVDEPYVDEKPTFWSRLSTGRKVAVIAGASITAIASIFVVNTALASMPDKQMPQFDKGGRHDFGGIAPSPFPKDGKPHPELSGEPRIHQLPPTAVHPDANGAPQFGDGDTDGQPPISGGVRPPHGDDREGDDRGERGEGDGHDGKSGFVVPTAIPTPTK